MFSRRYVALFALCAAAAPAQQAAPQKASDSPARFASAIEAFLQSDRTAPPPQQSILFIGSSIFRLWKNLTTQMAPLPVFNRAFGGSRTADVLHYMDEIVLPYQPKVIVYYCGSNDVNPGLPAAGIAGNFRKFVERVHDKLPETRVIYVAIQRAPEKRKHWDVVDEANTLAKEYCGRDRRLTFVDLNPALFGADGDPRLDLYLADKLHFHEPAYVEFTKLLRPVLERVWQSVN